MADGMIGAAPAGQPGTVSGTAGTAGIQAPQAPAAAAPQEQQPQVNYVTNEQLNAALDRIERLVQSSTDKSYNRVQKMIASMQQAGIQNPTEAQARAMLAMQDKGSEQEKQEPAARPEQASTGNPEADVWIKQNGGDVSKSYWLDIYDAAQEAGVPMIVQTDPEYAEYFMENGSMKQFSKDKPRHFVRAFEQAFAAKKERLAKQGAVQSNLASSPGLGSGGGKSNFYDPKTTSRIDLLSQGLHERRK